MDNGFRMQDLFREECLQWKEANQELHEKQIQSHESFSLRDKASNGWTNLKAYCFSEFMEGSVQIYSEIAKFCKEHDATHVYDIGSCIAFQGKIFTSMGMQYTGVEMEADSINDTTFYDGMEMIKGIYPFAIEVKDKEHTIAVSNLCLGYLINDGKQGYEQLAKDFRYFCGSVGPDCFDVFQQHFGVVSASQDGYIIWADTQRVHEPNKEALEKVANRFKTVFNIELDIDTKRVETTKPIKRLEKQKNEKENRNFER